MAEKKVKATVKKAVAKAEPAVKKAVEKAEPVVEKAVAKAEPVVKEAAKKAEPAVKKAATTAKKATTAAKKATTAAKKAVVKKETTVTIELPGNKNYTTADLEKIAKDVWVYDLGKKAADLKAIELYVQPYESVVYYVFNETVKGCFII